MHPLNEQLSNDGLSTSSTCTLQFFTLQSSIYLNMYVFLLSYIKSKSKRPDAHIFSAPVIGPCDYMLVDTVALSVAVRTLMCTYAAMRLYLTPAASPGPG